MSKDVETQEGRTLLLEPAVLTRKLPENFHDEDLRLFEHELIKTIPATELVKLRNVRVSSDGILFRGLKLLPESFAFPFLADQWPTRSRIKFFIINQLLRRRRRIEREALWITDDWSYGYFHWLSDALAKLYVMRDQLHHLVLLLPSRYKSLPFVTPSLTAFGVKQVEFIAPDEVLTIDKLRLPMPVAPSGHFREEVVKGVRELLLAQHGRMNENASGKRLYISRSRAPKRRIANEDDVINLLREFDFKVVHAEDLSFPEQIQIASSVELLVSNHGAGLTNMLFMPDHSRVLELRCHGDNVNNCYYTLASSLGLNYSYQNCYAQNPGEAAHTAELIVDIDVLRSNLTTLTAA